MKVQDLFDVSGKAVLVTGGASGIGYACAEVMADNGAAVTLADIDEVRLAEAADALRARNGTVFTEVADVLDRASLARAFDAVAARHGRIDVVFANAGIGGGPGFVSSDAERRREPSRAFECLSDEVWDRVMATNLRSMFWTLQLAAGHMKARGGGKVVVTSSVSAFKLEPFVSAIYVTSKAGVTSLLRQAAFELAAYGINVNALAPGPCVTNIGGGRLQDRAAQDFYATQHPAGRMAVPGDMQGAAIYLASRASDHVFGQHIVIDGGFGLGMPDRG